MGRRKAEVSRARRRQLIQEARWIATLGRTREWTVEQIQDEILRRFGGEVFPAEARMHANGWGVSFVREALQALATQEGLDASGLQDADVLRWLRGEVYPRDSLDRLCRLFACHQARLGWPVIGNADPIDHTPTQGPAEQSSGPAAQAALPAPLIGDPPADDQLDDIGASDGERALLAQVAAILGVAGGPDMRSVVGQHVHTGPLDRLSLAVRRPTRVDKVTVDRLERVTAIHRELYHSLSSYELVDEVTGHLHAVTRLLHGTQQGVLRRRLAAIAGETAGHAAWLSHDLDDRRAAEQHYATAAIATREAGDPALDAYIRGFRSQVRGSDGAVADALALARGASASAARSGTATVRSWLATLEAQALAAMGDAEGCLKTLNRAEVAIEQTRPEEDPAWMYRFDRIRFAAVAGCCYRRLGELATAECMLGEALAALEPWCTRRRAEVLLELAYVKADQRDIDRAGWLAAESLTAALEARSVAGVDRVRRFRNAYERWRDTEAMKALDQRLAECL
jgi:hypothetical protein